jgi:hypothetical protein
MIVWGGLTFDGVVNSGGRYSPATDTWTATRLDDSTPAGRLGHTAVWTGSEMIVWGGEDDAGLQTTGGRYVPASDTWQSLAGASPRTAGTAVWTGREMIVWGGDDSADNLNTGDRYDPAADSWSSVLADATAPSARDRHAALWDGREMIVWGGYSRVVGGPLGDGGRYDPAIDLWSAVTATGAPEPRAGHAAVWTGTDMIVWGGGVLTGGLYCGCSAGTYYRDADGDGRGDPLQMTCGPASGFVAAGNDCDDGSSAAWSAPGEARDLNFTDATTLVWNPPADAGGTAPPTYDVVRAAQVSAGADLFVCVATDVAGLTASDAVVPAANQAFFYQVRARSACPGGFGPLGLKTAAGVPIAARACP